VDDKMTALLRRLIRDRRGQDLVEYALLISLVGLAAAVAVGGFGSAARQMWSTIITMASVLLQ